jgi:hypothetical protein
VLTACRRRDGKTDMTDTEEAALLRLDALSLQAHAARRDEILAGKGAFPSFEELQRGLPFLRGDMLLDIQTFIDSELLEPDHIPTVRKALTLARANPSAVTLRAASDSMEHSAHHTARRLDLYAAWLGDPIGRDRTIRRGFEDVRLNNIAQSATAITLAMGLTRYSPRGFRPSVTPQDVERVFDQGLSSMERISALHARLQAAMNSPDVDPDVEPQNTDRSDLLAEDRAEVERFVEELDDGIPDALLGTPAGPPKDMIVVPALDPKGGNSNTRDNRKSWVGLAGIALPLVQTGDVAGIAAELSARWPHAREIVHTVVGDLALGGPIRFRPTLVVGQPGSGKTALLRAIASAAGLPVETYNLGGMSDASAMGTSAQWSTARESVPLQMIKRSKTANGAVVWDEIEKVGTSRHNGSALDALLPMLETAQSRAIRDLCLEVECDLSMISHFATANSVTDIPAPLRDRMRILRMPDPDWSHLGTLVGQIIADIARDRGVDPRWYPPLAEDEIDIIKSAWPGGSLRRLRMSIEILLDGRDAILGRA